MGDVVQQCPRCDRIWVPETLAEFTDHVMNCMGKTAKKERKKSHYIYVIGQTPESLNKYLGKSGGWYAYQSDKKKWDKLMSVAVLDEGVPPEPIERSMVTIFYTFPTKGRRDADNFSGKQILDPLVKYGVLKDDSFFNVELVLRAGYKKGISRTTVTVREIRRRG